MKLIAAEEVTEPMILLLLAVGVLYSLWGGLADALTIFAIILVLVLVEVGNEFRAKRAIAALQRIAAPRARVRRGGEVMNIEFDFIEPLAGAAFGFAIPLLAWAIWRRRLAAVI